MGIIAITMRQYVEPKYGEKRDSISTQWLTYLKKVLPRFSFLLIPNNIDITQDLLKTTFIDGLLLSNGNDWGSCPERDEVEKYCFTWCRDNQKPILGVCRGLHVINGILGGSMVHNIYESKKKSHAGTQHSVQLIENSYQKLAKSNSISVNSYHNHGVLINGLAHGLKPFAIATGNVVEGVFHQYEKIYAIQWHPERVGSYELFDKNLFRYIFNPTYISTHQT
tara:strand:- start:9932 stop:10600 length:669 start_codon:yes stop_codon:yes gene_type:complete